MYMYDPNLSRCSGMRRCKLSLSRLAAEPDTQNARAPRQT